MRHDVIADRYARLYEQPYQLACLGHDVLGICLSYFNCISVNEEHDASPGKLQWIGLSPGKYKLGLPLYYSKVLTLIKRFKPDVIIGASDALHIILAEKLAAKTNALFCADLYDHFETFRLTQIPFIKQGYVSALKKAALISTVSDMLATHVKDVYRVTGNAITLRSTINSDVFHPMDKHTCRATLQLPANAKLIGTAGGLFEERGIKPLYEAFNALAKKDADIYLVLAGITDPELPPPQHERVIYLGQITHEKVAKLFCALDVGVIFLNNTEYSRCSFPQKAFEMLGCKTPIVAARIGEMIPITKEAIEITYEYNNPVSLEKAIRHQLEAPTHLNIPIETWRSQAIQMEKQLVELVSNIA